jgi:dihydropteroate synthase
MQWAGLDLSAPIVMGIMNVTPDSFSDGGDLPTHESITARAESFCASGAKILDIGGESTRPGAVPPSVDEEIRRVVPAIEAARPIAAQYGAKISVDTRRVAVMAAAVAAGADIINDVSALTSEAEAVAFVAAHQLPVVLCHMQGTPADMQHAPRYDDVVVDIKNYFHERMAACRAAGLGPDKICLDVGIGFGKTTAHNITLLQNLAAFADMGAPMLVGLSRKRLIADLTGETNPKNRLGGSLAGAIFAAQNGAQILRVHDVHETVQALRVWQGLQ